MYRKPQATHDINSPFNSPPTFTTNQRPAILSFEILVPTLVIVPNSNLIQVSQPESNSQSQPKTQLDITGKKRLSTSNPTYANGKLWYLDSSEMI